MVFEEKFKKGSNRDTGYFAFRDSKTKRLEISWANIQKEIPDLGKITEDYYKSLKKAHKKIKLKSEGKNETNEHTSAYFYWELEKEKVQGYVMVWICQKSNRVIISNSQFDFKEKSRFKPLVMEIISKINCHTESPFSMWSAPNLQIYTPYLSVKLVERSFLIGLTYLRLKNDDIDLFSYRVGLADQKIENADQLPEWYKDYYKKHFPGVPSKYTPEGFKKLIFKKKIPIWQNEITLKKKFKFKRTSDYYLTYLWYNPDKNDIYCFIFSTKKDPSGVQRDLMEKMAKLAIGAN
jgi:hypothetical protein